MTPLIDLNIMDKDNLFRLGLTACAVGVSLFIFWGPKVSRRSKSNGTLVGLQNLGLTCFLNSLLQALGACPCFIDWLQLVQGNGNVTDNLLRLLKALCYEKIGIEESISPRELIVALSAHGKFLAPQEQDTHELFLLLINTLEEEEHKTLGCDYESMLKEELNEPTSLSAATSHGDLFYSSMESLASRSGIRERGDVLESPVRRPSSSPFRGFLTTQIHCLQCTYKSTLCYDKFDSLLLTLPPASPDAELTLNQLLDLYFKAELIEDYVCEACNKDAPSHQPSRALKTVRIGKMPRCLCLHISRTHITPEGFAYKRNNFVEFPELFSMAQYSQNSAMAVKKEFQKKESLVGVVNGLKLTPTEGSPAIGSPQHAANTLRKCYQLKAVIEHRGSVHNGHFVTYRRPPIALSPGQTKWYFTSDADVRPTSLSDAMAANAYMLFYERYTLPSL